MQRAGRSISHPPGMEELFATATCAPRSLEGLASEKVYSIHVSVRRVTACESQIRVPLQRTATVQLECSLYRFPFCSFSAFFYPLALSFFPSLPFLRARTRWRLRYFFIMHTFAGAIAISFGLVSALSARKSIFTVAKHQRENVGEFSLFFPISFSLFLSLFPSLSKIFLGAENHAQP